MVEKKNEGSYQSFKNLMEGGLKIPRTWF